jgi:aspartate/tyrosine/aromatic aminotransferase
MSTGQRLRLVKDDIARIERFLPVMKRVLMMLRAELRLYRERVGELELARDALERQWRAIESAELAATIDGSIDVELRTSVENLVGVDIDVVNSLVGHCKLSPVFLYQSSSFAAIVDLACERSQLAEHLRLEQRNISRLEEAEEEFVFLINGSEQVRLPPLRNELARLAREMDEENAMAATIARLLRERARAKNSEQEVELWPLLQ